MPTYEKLKDLFTQRKNPLTQFELENISSPPTSIKNGDTSFDGQYFYVYSNGWKRIAISTCS